LPGFKCDTCAVLKRTQQKEEMSGHHVVCKGKQVIDDDKQDDHDRGQRNGKEKIEMGEGGHVLSRKIALDLGWIMKHDCLS
jgi:hypothetical protein